MMFFLAFTKSLKISSKKKEKGFDKLSRTKKSLFGKVGKISKISNICFEFMKNGRGKQNACALEQGCQTSVEPWSLNRQIHEK